MGKNWPPGKLRADVEIYSCRVIGYVLFPEEIFFFEIMTDMLFADRM